MSVFSLTSQIFGVQHPVTADWRGKAIVVSTEAGVTLARNINDATRAAAKTLGPALEEAGRKKAPWGLHVDVEGNQAVYGEWPLLPGPVQRDPRPSPLSRIRARWRPGDSPLEALDNAIRIIHAFAGAAERAAA